jgi:hypothetical protein
VVVLVLLFFGFTQWNWFGTGPSTGQPNTSIVTSPSGSPSASPNRADQTVADGPEPLRPFFFVRRNHHD